MTDMVDVEILRRADGIEPTGFDEINQDITKDAVGDLMREIAADQTPEASDVLQKVAEDGGIEAHAMKGDPSKCPFLMGKIGVGQYVEISEIQPAPEGRSVKEIREERRRLRAQAKEVPAESVVSATAKDNITQEKISDFEPRLEQVIHQAHVEAVSISRPFERKKVTTPEVSKSSQNHLEVKSEPKTKNKGVLKDKTNQHGHSSDAVRIEYKKPQVTAESALKLPSGESIGVEPTIEVSSIQLVQEQKPTFSENIHDVSHVVGAPKRTALVNRELLAPDPGLATELSDHTPISTEAVTYVSQNVSHGPGFDKELTTAVASPKDQARPENSTSLNEVMMPYLGDDAIEKAAVQEIVQVLNEKIRDLIDTGSLIPYETEIAKTIERLMQKIPEELRIELRTIVNTKIQEMIAAAEVISDQRETFNILGTHEFKFFHHKAQSQLQIKEKASRYLLTLISKDYVLA